MKTDVFIGITKFSQSYLSCSELIPKLLECLFKDPKIGNINILIEKKYENSFQIIDDRHKITSSLNNEVKLIVYTAESNNDEMISGAFYNEISKHCLTKNALIFFDTFFYDKNCCSKLISKHIEMDNDITIMHYPAYYLNMQCFLIKSHIYNKWLKVKDNKNMLHRGEYILRQFIFNNDIFKYSYLDLNQIGFPYHLTNNWQIYHGIVSNKNAYEHYKSILKMKNKSIDEMDINDLWEIIPTFIKQISIDVTDKYSMKPINNYTGNISKKNNDLNSSEVEQLFLNLFEKRVLHNRFIFCIDFHGIGDPLLSEYFADYCRLTKIVKDKYRKSPEIQSVPKYEQIGYEVSIYTDGLNLTEDKIKTILETEIDNIFINLSACDSKSYMEYWGVDNYQKIINNINLLNQMKLKYNRNKFPKKPNIIIEYFLNTNTKKYIMQFIDKWMISSKYLAKNGLKFIDENFYNEKLPIEYTVIKGYNNFQNRLEDKKITDYSPQKRFPCRRVFDGGIFINNTGKVSICNQDINNEYILCLLKELNNNIYNINYIDEFNNFKKEHLNKNYNLLCKNCDQWYIPVI